MACLSQTLKALYDFYRMRSHLTHRQIYRLSYSESMCDNTLIYNNIILHKHKRSTYGRARGVYFKLRPWTINRESNQLEHLPQQLGSNQRSKEIPQQCRWLLLLLPRESHEVIYERSFVFINLYQDGSGRLFLPLYYDYSKIFHIFMTNYCE